jgi:hypothetical protein
MISRYTIDGVYATRHIVYMSMNAAYKRTMYCMYYMPILCMWSLAE